MNHLGLELRKNANVCTNVVIANFFDAKDLLLQYHFLVWPKYQ